MTIIGAPAGQHDITGRRGRVRSLSRTVLRRTGYAALSVPLAVMLTALCAAGRPRTALALDRRARRRFLTDDGPETAGAGRLLAYGLVCLPLGLVNLVLLLLLVPNTLHNLAYPLANPTPADYARAWGGPTLAGAWATHAAIALALVPVYLLVISGVVGVQTRLRDGLLRRRWVWWAPPLAAVLLAGTAVFVVALLRQL